MDIKQLTGALEAILYVSGDPVQIPDVAHAFNLTASEMEEVISALRDRGVPIKDRWVEHVYPDGHAVRFKEYWVEPEYWESEKQ